MSGGQPSVSRRAWTLVATVLPYAIVFGMAASAATAIALDPHRHDRFAHRHRLPAAVAAALR
ncbi:MAG: hypothetical protein JSR98_06365 [Proteobacteria bacterium]|nr:hypothetical protein [Pseudomonadota bacterium]